MMEKVNRTCNDCAFRGDYSRTARKRYCTKLGQYQEPNAAISCEGFLQTTAPDEPKKYIDADKIHDVIASHFCACSDETETALHSVWEELKAIPGEDVEKIKRGKWHDVYMITPTTTTQTCSACGAKTETTRGINCAFSPPPFCSQCGALMEGA